MYHTSRNVSLRVSERCILLLLTEISLGQLPRLDRYELVPCLRRGTPVVIKIFKKLCTLKHFMAAAACLLRSTYASEQHLPASRAPTSPTLRRRPLAFSLAQQKPPARPAGEQHPPSFYNPPSLMLASNF